MGGYMQLQSRALVLGLLTLVTFNFSHAAEPAFCNPQNFSSYEVDSKTRGVQRNHAYQLGKLVVVGLAVGNSGVAPVQALVAKFATTDASEKSCTWYFNDGNDDASVAFNHYY